MPRLCNACCRFLIIIILFLFYSFRVVFSGRFLRVSGEADRWLAPADLGLFAFLALDLDGEFALQRLAFGGDARLFFLGHGDGCGAEKGQLRCIFREKRVGWFALRLRRLHCEVNHTVLLMIFVGGGWLDRRLASLELHGLFVLDRQCIVPADPRTFVGRARLDRDRDFAAERGLSLGGSRSAGVRPAHHRRGALALGRLTHTFLLLLLLLLLLILLSRITGDHLLLVLLLLILRLVGCHGLGRSCRFAVVLWWL